MDTNTNANVLKFLRETLQRFFTKSPLFFKIWMMVSGALVLITGIPDLINSLPFHVTLPEIFNDRLNTAVAWASRGAFVMAWLTTAEKPIGLSTDGDILKTTAQDKLPFTAAADLKKVTKK